MISATLPPRQLLTRNEVSPEQRGIGPIARLCGMIFVAGALLDGFGAAHGRLPTETPYLLLLPALACLVLTPRDRLRSVRVNVPTLLLLSWVAASTLWATNPSATAALVRVQVPLLLTLVAVSQVLSTSAVCAALRWAVRIAVLLSILALLSDPTTRTSIDPAVPLDGWRGSFLHKNLLGLFLAFGVAVALCLERGRARVVMLLLTTTLLLGSQSTTGMSGAALVVAVYAFANYYSGRAPGDRKALLVATALVCAAVAAIVAANLSTVLAAFGKEPDLTGRTEIWTVVIEAIQARPVSGYGLGGLLNSETPTSFTYDLWLRIGERAPHAHNGTLDVAGQLGITGVLLHASALASTAVGAVRAYRRSMSVALFGSTLIAGQLLMSVSENVFLGPWLLVLIILQGLILSITSAAPKDEVTAASP